MNIYLVMLDSFIMPFESKPDKKCFSKNSKLFIIDGSLPLSILPEIFLNGFNHKNIKDITGTWR